MLTQRQTKTYQFIQKYVADFGYAPTMREIAMGIGIKSRGVVHRYVQALVSEKLVNIIPNRRRNIQLVDSNRQYGTIPLVGMIAAGEPIEAIQQDESVNLIDLFLGPNRFALRVKGDSMLEEGIFDGDLVVCEYCQTADDGQIVVALIDNQEATLKRLMRQPENMVALLPANAFHKPMIYPTDRVNVQGRYIGLLRFNNR